MKKFDNTKLFISRWLNLLSLNVLFTIKGRTFKRWVESSDRRGSEVSEGLSLGDEDEDEGGAVAMRTEGASTKEEDEEWEDVEEGAKGKDEVEEFYKLDDYDTQPDSKKRADITTRVYSHLTYCLFHLVALPGLAD